MAHRTILTERQRAALFALPTGEAELLQHYTLADDDLEHIRARRRGENRLGFALQLCAFRYPGRLLAAGEAIPEPVLAFIGAQIGLTGDALLPYATRRQTRQQHLKALRETYGYRMFSGRRARDLRAWLDREAEAAQSNDDLARRFVEECRRTQTILPGVSRIGRLCADALVAAERRIEARIADRIDEDMRASLDALLTETVDGKASRFIWLRRFEVGANSADMNRLLDRLEFLQRIGLDATCLAGIPPHRIARLRRQGERYFTDGLQDISGNRRLAILAVCAVEWHSAIADTIVETHDRIVGKTWRDAKRLCEARIVDANASVQDTLRAFFSLGTALLAAMSDEVPLAEAVATSCGWDDLEKLVASSARLTNTMEADPLAHVAQGYHRFRRYASRMLEALDISAATVAAPLIAAAKIVRSGGTVRPTGFLGPRSKWHRHLKAQDIDDHRLWEVAVLFHLRDAFRSGDIWLAR